MSGAPRRVRHHRVVRAVLASLAIHIVAAMALWPAPHRPATVREAARSEALPDDLVVDMVLVPDSPARGEGGGGDAATGAAPHRAAPAAPRAAPDAWQRVSIGFERPGAEGTGASGPGSGSGAGTGFGLGAGGGGVRVPDDIPAPPPPPAEEVRVSKARPAKLVYPSRDREVEDEADLFVARVTVDRDGDVVGANMVRTRPGARGDQAASAIWSFRYLPALDDDGRPIPSTFEQTFQIR